MTYMDSPEYVQYRRIVHAGSYMVMLKRKEQLIYDLYSVKPEDIEVDGCSLGGLNNAFCKKATNTVVRLDEILETADPYASTEDMVEEKTEDRFREWFKNQIIPEGDSNAGNKYSEITIQTYINDIKFHKLEIDGKLRTLFATKDLNIIDSMLVSPEVTDGRKTAIRKYRQFIVEMTGDVLEDNIFTPEWFRSKAAEFPTFDEEANNLRQQFLQKYSPDRLRDLEGMDLLRTIFLNDENKDNLCYELEFNNKIREHFGSIKSGTAYKYGLHYSKKHNSWATGTGRNPQFLSEDEAIELGSQIRDYLVDGADIVLGYEKVESIEGYEELYRELNAATEGFVNRVWFLKYYHMIAPNLFPTTYSLNAQSTVLTAIGEDPDDNAVVRMGQMQLFVHKCDISSVLFSKIFWSYYEPDMNEDEGGQDSNVSIAEAVNVDENEARFREWLSRQINSRGKHPTLKTINNNCYSLRKVCQLMDIDGYPDMDSLFEIIDLDTFIDVCERIKTHPDYAEINYSCNKRSLNTALSWYEKYLDEMEEFSEEDDDAVMVFPYSKEEFLKTVFLTPDEYDKLYKLLMYKKNVILQGSPGVGKTFLAKRFAYSVIGAKDDRFIETVQFHQNYSYEDFIMGYKPSDESFELRTGVFYNFCEKARRDTEHDYFFIIDEINRGNLSKILGELMMLIEGDKRGENNRIKLAYRNEEFYVPKNLYLIGMMNTADRSLAMMDYALRRRFSFFDVEPAFEKSKFKEHLQGYITDSSVINKVISRFTDLNKKIADEENSGLGKGFCIGHSYFCVPPVSGQSDDEWYNTIIEYEVAPLLDEYWWDDKNKAEDCKKELVKD